MKLSILDIRLGAIYRIAARNQLSRQSIAALIHERTGFAQAVHELAADAFVQAGGNKWDLPARERVGYAAAWASDNCKP